MKNSLYSSNTIANNILLEFAKRKKKISPMKLQKILYIVYKEYFTRTEQQLFFDVFEAWQYGPVLRNVYDEFKNFGASDITEYAKNSDGSITIADLDANDQLKKVIELVITYYFDYSAGQLSKLTHDNENSAWLKAMNSTGRLNDADIKSEKSYLC